MTIPWAERLRQAILDSARGLERPSTPVSERTRPPAAGDLFVFYTGEQAALEWLIVWEHAGDPSRLLLVPGDDFPLVGPPDLELPRDLVGRPLTVRCAQALWVMLQFCEQKLRTGSIPAEALDLVRRKIAALALGRASESEDRRQADADPEYQVWLGLVARARERLHRRADQTQSTLAWSSRLND